MCSGGVLWVCVCSKLPSLLLWNERGITLALSMFDSDTSTHTHTDNVICSLFRWDEIFQTKAFCFRFEMQNCRETHWTIDASLHGRTLVLFSPLKRSTYKRPSFSIANSLFNRRPFEASSHDGDWLFRFSKLCYRNWSTYCAILIYLPIEHDSHPLPPPPRHITSYRTSNESFIHFGARTHTHKCYEWQSFGH